MTFASLLVLALAASAAPLLTDPTEATPAAPSCAAASSAWGPNPCAFGSGMVLSAATAWRSSGGAPAPARIWGTAGALESVTLSGLPAGARVTPSNPFTATANGTWSIEVAADASPSAVNLTFLGAGGKAAVLTDVLFGLVVLCSGQCESPCRCMQRGASLPGPPLHHTHAHAHLPTLPPPPPVDV
jgi:hypothetical protein